MNKHNNFEKIIGYDYVKEDLEIIIDVINNKEKYNKFNVKIPKGIVLFGEPGLGKTLTAKCFIDALNVNKYILRKNTISNSFVEEMRKTVEEAVDNTPSIVLLDDIDKYSNNDAKHRKTDEFIVLQSLIDEAKDKDVYFIATANNLMDLPESLLRPGRFDKKIEFNYPSIEETKLIAMHYLENKKIADDIDYDEIARIINGNSCAILETVMNEAGLYAGYNNRNEISMDDIVKAILSIIYSEDSISLRIKTEMSQKVIAYHEAGHTLVSEILEPGSVNLVTIEDYKCDGAGVTSSKLHDDYWFDVEKMENRIKILLAGKAATEVFFNKLDVGSTSDLARAERIIERFITRYGMKSFLVNERIKTISNNQLFIIDKLITKKLKGYYKSTKKIIRKNKDKLEMIANGLLEKKILRHKDISNIMNFE